MHDYVRSLEYLIRKLRGWNLPEAAAIADYLEEQKENIPNSLSLLHRLNNFQEISDEILVKSGFRGYEPIEWDPNYDYSRTLRNIVRNLRGWHVPVATRIAEFLEENISDIRTPNHLLSILNNFKFLAEAAKKDMRLAGPKSGTWASEN